MIIVRIEAPHFVAGIVFDGQVCVEAPPILRWCLGKLGGWRRGFRTRIMRKDGEIEQMGRTLKRVPMDFSWPLNKTWEGYVNPFAARTKNCAACGGTGLSPQARLFSDQWYGKRAFDPEQYGATPLTVDHPAVQAFAKRNCERSPEYCRSIESEAARLFEMWRHQWSHQLIQADVDALLEADRLYDFTRVPRTTEQMEVVRKKVAEGGNSWLPSSNGYRPTADEVNDWSMRGMGHDAINQWTCVRARCAREGVQTGCNRCSGEGNMWPNPADKELHEAWKPFEPRTGEGFQLWETTSEGSPMSPVFSTLEGLCDWCADNATTFGSYKTTSQEWRRMLNEDFVCHTDGRNVFM